jgi:YHS domain-containing protein
MKKTLFISALILAVSLAFAYAGVVQQKEEATAKDPVCGMTVKKSEAKATYDYKGTTYYFCSDGCKESFVKDPEKYLAKAEKESPQAGAMGMHRHAGMMTHRQMGSQSRMGAANCPLHAADVEMGMENLPDGVALRFTSKNSDTVKKIQEHFAGMPGGCPACGTCPHQGQADK